MEKTIPVNERTLFFSQEDFPDPTPEEPDTIKTEFYMTEEGKRLRFT